MVCCAVSHCKNTSAKISKCKDGITFHRFPQDEYRRKRWEIAVNREKEWSSTSSSAVCSDHFDAGDFYLTSSGLRRLSVEAVPAINISICEEPQPTITITEPDIKPTDTEQVKQLKHELKRTQIIADNRKKQIKVMWQAQKRLRAKIDKMRLVIKHLVQNKKEIT